MKNFIKKWILPPSFFLRIIKLKSLIKLYINYKSIDFEKNSQLFNIHNNKRCFVVGTGPSIANQDLTLLKNEIVIGVSGLFVHNGIDLINPNYYVLPPCFEYHSETTSQEEFRIWFQDMDKILNDDVIMILHIGDKKYIDKFNVFKNKKKYWVNFIYHDESQDIETLDLKHIPNISSVSEIAIHLSIYLGCEKIYILGFDHNWFDALHIYFNTIDYTKYFKDIGESCALKHGFDSEFQMIRHAKIFNKYKKYYALKQNIYNANSNLNSYVDTFPKVKFESLFEK